MSFYEFDLPYQTHWSDCQPNSQYTLSTQATFMDQSHAAVVPTFSPVKHIFHDVYCHQYNSPANENYQGTHQSVNQHYNQYQYQNLRNTNYQLLITKRNYANHFKKISTSANVNLKRIAKPKRHRTVFKIEQVEALEMFYKHKQFVTQKDRQQLQEILQISNKTIKVWFQNRRLKDRKKSQHNLPISTDEMNENDIFQNEYDDIDANITQEIERLTEELKQKQEKDELDDFLLSVIKNPNQDNTPVTSVDIAQHIFYEPISPAESCEEKDVSLQTLDPKELLKTFLNFQE